VAMEFDLGDAIVNVRRRRVGRRSQSPSLPSLEVDRDREHRPRRIHSRPVFRPRTQRQYPPHRYSIPSRYVGQRLDV
jgi:hypothetical protein